MDKIPFYMALEVTITRSSDETSKTRNVWDKWDNKNNNYTCKNITKDGSLQAGQGASPEARLWAYPSHQQTMTTRPEQDPCVDINNVLGRFVHMGQVSKLKERPKT